MCYYWTFAYYLQVYTESHKNDVFYIF